MKLNPPFIKTTVQAGDPLTAQAWNDVINAVGAIYDHIDTTEASSVKVQVAAPNLSLSLVRVTATRDDISVEAVRPVPPSTLHTFPGLPPGNYKIRAEAAGFDPATLDLTVAATGPPPIQTITLTKKGSFMPMVFGLTLANALAQLSALNITVSEVLDVTGTAVPPTKPGTAQGQALVLTQFPIAGVPLAPGDPAQLLISAALTPEVSIEVPSLTGLTLAEASKALEALGLKIGKTSTGTKPSSGGGHLPPPNA